MLDTVCAPLAKGVSMHVMRGGCFRSQLSVMSIISGGVAPQPDIAPTHLIGLRHA